MLAASRLQFKPIGLSELGIDAHQWQEAVRAGTVVELEAHRCPPMVRGGARRHSGRVGGVAYEHVGGQGGATACDSASS